MFVEWKKNMEKSTGRKIKVLRSDNGREYKSDPFLKICRDEGIVKHFTVRKTPQQNGIEDEHDFARECLLYVIQCRIIEELLG